MSVMSGSHPSDRKRSGDELNRGGGGGSGAPKRRRPELEPGEIEPGEIEPPAMRQSNNTGPAGRGMQAFAQGTASPACDCNAARA